MCQLVILCTPMKRKASLAARRLLSLCVAMTPACFRWLALMCPAKNMRQIELTADTSHVQKPAPLDVTSGAGFNLLLPLHTFKICHCVYRECSLIVVVLAPTAPNVDGTG